MIIVLENLMPNKLKELVSKKKIRYQEDGFDLDLTYITHRIIAMGFPAQSWEGIYRNHIDDVVNFFEKKHAGHYQIYNLCNERHIDEQKFEQDSINHSYPFNDHNPPMFRQMIACCQEIHKYLDSDSENVVAIQCKAGKGRTGVIVCAYLLLEKSGWSATQVLEYYGKNRTYNGKGVTIPSQIRYVYYFAHYLRKSLTYESIDLRFSHLVLEEMPNILGNGYELQFVIYVYDPETKKLKGIHTSRFYEAKKDNTRALKLFLDNDIVLSDDLKFQFILKSKFGKKENLCHCWLNTFFIIHKPPFQSFNDSFKDFHPHNIRCDMAEKPKSISPLSTLESESIKSSQLYKLTLLKHEIDKANKDINNKTFPFNFAITFVFENTPDNYAHIAAAAGPHQSDRSPVTNSKLKRYYPNHPKMKRTVNENDSSIPYLDSLNSDNPDDDHSESSESSTKNSCSSDID